MPIENESADSRISTAAKSNLRWVKLLLGPTGVSLSFLWGLAEGTLFFVVPDVFLSLAAVFSLRRVWRHIVSATLGAICAGALMYGWAAADPFSARSAVQHVPFVTSRMFAEVDTGYQRQGIGAVFIGPLLGIPYKIYAVEAPLHSGMLSFLAATAPARAYRFVLVSLLANFLARIALARWKLPPGKLAAVHAAAWIIFYGFYWTRIARS